MADISKIKVPNGSNQLEEYTIRDNYARQRLAELTANIIRFIGYTTTTIIDGSEISSIDIVGQKDKHTAVSGDVVIYDPNGATTLDEQEFIWDGQAWREFGSKQALKALAFKDNAKATVTIPEPAKNVDVTNLTYLKATSAKVSIPTNITIDTSASAATKSMTVTGTANAFTYKRPVKGTNAKTRIKAEVSNASINMTGSVTLPTSLKLTTGGSAITGITSNYKYLEPISVYGVSGSNTASTLTSAGDVKPGSQAVLTKGTLPSFYATEDSSTETLTFTFNRGTKSSLSGGAPTEVTLPTFGEVPVPKAATNATNVFSGTLSTPQTKSAQATQIVESVTEDGRISCITGVVADPTTTITGYTTYTLNQPTVTLDTSSSSTRGANEVDIETESWSTEDATATISYTDTVNIPYELKATDQDVDVTISHTATEVSGTASISVTEKDITVTAS